MDAVDVLKFLAGKWQGEEIISPTPWMPGGKAQGIIHNSSKFDNTTLVHDYESRRDGETWFSAHGVITISGPKPDSFGLFWFDSFGFLTSEAAKGIWDGETLAFVRRSSRGVTRHSFAPDGDGKFHARLESSVESDEMKPILTATYLRCE
jgi:hypothetical protein